MMRWLLAALAVALVATGSAAQQTITTTETQLIDPSVPGALPKWSRIGFDAGFDGVIATYRRVDGVPTTHAQQFGPRRVIWPWASVTKQVVAVLAMQQVAEGRLTLDTPVSAYLPQLAGGRTVAPTLRQLLQHRSGLRNADDSARDANGFPSFYSNGPTGLDWCLADRAVPPTDGWRYNNCDYIVVGAILERVTGKPLADLFQDRIAQPAGLDALRLANGIRPEQMEWETGGPTVSELAILSRYGAAGGLVGAAIDMLAFDAALMEGRLLPADARVQLWKGDPALGFMALGQWVFDARLKGCGAPVRLVERRGAIGRYQVRNVIAPDLGRAVVMLTSRGEGEFDFGEIWSASGFSYAVLSSELCA